MAKQETAQQQPLFAHTQTPYGWKSVKEVQRGDLIVIMEQEVKIQAIKIDDDNYLISYTDASTGKKVEQIYNAIDSVYARLA